MMHPAGRLLPGLAIVLAGYVVSQEDTAPKQDTAAVLRCWAHAFDARHLELRGTVTFGAESPIYGKAVMRGGLLHRDGSSTRTHMWALQQLLFHAESQATLPLGQAVLRVASVGLERSLYDPQVQQVRELGHWTLMRMHDSAAVWLYLMHVAGGEPLRSVPWLQEEGDENATRDPALRVAALRLLGQRNKSVFRPIVQAALGDGDPRVRLSAAEALGRMNRRLSLPVLLRAMGTERHGVVSQALVHTLQKLLKKHHREIPRKTRDRAVRACLRLLDTNGWRVQMRVVELIAKYPCMDSIPALIDVMRRRETDMLRKVVNKNASPLLRHKAWQALRVLTGAVLPKDPDTWEEFWERERDRIVLVEPRRQKPPPNATRVRSTFYGIPVLGQEVTFLIDTSGSMKEEVWDPSSAKPNKLKSKRRGRRKAKGKGKGKTRLQHAREQIQVAVQTMDPHSRYHLMTFSSVVRVWNHKPVPPNAQSFRALTACLGHFAAGGGTDVFAGVLRALNADQARFGQPARNDIDELFVLSDGLPSTGDVTDPDEILTAVRQVNRYAKARINTVFTGQGEGAEFMRKLAEQNGGVFVQR